MKFSCERCLYSTDLKKCFERHKLSKTHIKKENGEFEAKYKCKFCEKTFKSKNGYYNNLRFCKLTQTKKEQDALEKKKKDEEEIEKKLKEYEEIKKMIIDLLKSNNEILKTNTDLNKQNKEILQENTEMKNMFVEISKKDFVTNNIDNSHNINSKNKIDINVFLNDKCKNAINFSSLIESIVIGIKDIENIEKNGYVKTITDIVSEKIGNYTIFERPLHFFLENAKNQDPPNDTIHIKDNDIWNEEDMYEHDVLLTNMNAINIAFDEKTKENEPINQEVKKGRRYNKTKQIIENVLDKVKINEEQLSVEQ